MPETPAQKRWRLDNAEHVREQNRQKYIRNRASVLSKSKARYERMKSDPHWRYQRRMKQAEDRREMSAWIRGLKAAIKCAHCGEGREPCLDFHHVDPSEKEGGISSMLGNIHCKQKILAEIAKCIVLCANCHRIVHANERA